MEFHISDDPVAVAFLSAVGVVVIPHHLSDLVQEFQIGVWFEFCPDLILVCHRLCR